MKKVLIIDDDPIIVAIYREHFEAEGFDVRTAADGKQGLSAVQEFRPDVVLLDLDMPNASGLDWMREVRANPATRDLPVVVCSAGTVAWQMSAAKNTDATYVLSKDRSKPEEVVAAAKRALGIGHWKVV